MTRVSVRLLDISPSCLQLARTGRPGCVLRALRRSKPEPRQVSRSSRLQHDVPAPGMKLALPVPGGSNFIMLFWTRPKGHVNGENEVAEALAPACVAQCSTLRNKGRTKLGFRRRASRGAITGPEHNPSAERSVHAVARAFQTRPGTSLAEISPAIA